MKITVDTKALERMTKLASEVADKKAPNDILRAALVKVTADGLSVSATNLVTSAMATTAASGKSKPTAGALAVDAAALHAAVKSFDGEAVTLSADEKLRLTIESGASKISLLGARPDAMPAIPAVDAYKLHEVDAAALARIIRRGAYPVDQTGSSGTQVRGAIVETDGAVLVVCGLSGHRLAEQRMPCSAPPFSAVVDSTGLARIVAALDAHGGTARMGLQGDYFAVAFDGAAVLVKLNRDERRMPYEQVIPAHTNVATVERDALMRAARLASLVSDQMSEKSLDAFRIGIADGSMFVRNSHATKGDASTEIETEGKCVDISVGLTWRYLTEALGHIDADKVSVAFGNDVAPILLWPTGQEGERHLIMVRR